MSPMSPFQRKGNPIWYVRRDIRGIGNLTLSTRTKSSALARQYDQLILDLRDLGRLDALAALKAGKVTLAELRTNQLPAQLNQLLCRVVSPPLSQLLQEWLEIGAQDTGLRDRSMQRYASSWRRLSEILPENARIGDLTQGFVAEFRRHRRAQATEFGKTLSPATLNRDLAALGAFLTWCARDKGLKVERPNLRYQRESKGRLRWLTSEELASFREHCQPEWRPLFYLLFATGMTISEALGLHRTDIDLKTRHVSIHEEYGRKLKRASRTRELAIPDSITVLLSDWLRSKPGSPHSLVFPFTYWPVRKVWKGICEAANIHGATIHDARHTYAVHAVQGGIPEARLQQLLGHSHAGTTRRYAMHSPEQFLDEDAERVARHMGMPTHSGPRLEKRA